MSFESPRQDAMTYRLRRTMLAAALVPLLASCSHAGRKYLDPNMDFGSVKTVAVLPFQNLTRDNLAGDRVREVFANMLLATGAVYVLPQGEVARGIIRTGLANPASPSVEEAVKLATSLKVDALIVGVVKEYGELRSGTAVANVCSVSAQMMETATGRVVWSAATTKGGIGMGDRLLGGGGAPLNDVTEAAVNDLLNKLLK
jgi:hypothetical protein